MAKSTLLDKIDSINKPNDVLLIPIRDIKKNSKRVHRMFMMCINVFIRDSLLILSYQVDHFGPKKSAIVIMATGVECTKI